MTIVYLDIDDEITSAASRIRASEGTRVAIVLPAGSRLGTSRMNFRLLAREAAVHGRQLAVVCPEASTRALAASAGLPVHASVLDYEAALERTGSGDTPGSGPAPVSLAASRAPDAGTPAVDVAPGAGAPRSAGSSAPRAAGVAPEPGVHRSLPVAREPEAAAGDRFARGGGRAAGGRGARLVGFGLAGVVVLALLVAAVILLPSASILVVVRPEPLGPIRLVVTADPAAGAADPRAGLVPAKRITFPLSASGTFPASGTKVTETQATGAVRWQNCDPTRSYRIPGGTIVRTPAGTGFAIDETVFLPVAILSGNPPVITCQVRDVTVTATRAGEAGNVAAGAITVVPAAYNSVVIRVVNPAPTSGGSRTEAPLVSDKDVAGAWNELVARLDEQLSAVVADPAQIPAGMVAVAGTASRTDPVPSVERASLVGQEAAMFELALSATGSVTVVDPAAVEAVGEARLRAAVPPGYRLVEGSAHVDLGAATAAGEGAGIPVSATARIVREVDPAAIRAAVAGQPVDEARRAVAGYGEVTISTWPAWVTTVPTLDFRLEVTVRAETSGADGPAPSAAPAAPAGSSLP